MKNIINAISTTPVPTIFVIAGIILLILALGVQFKTTVVTTNFKNRVAGSVGTIFILVGCFLYMFPLLSSSGIVTGNLNASINNAPDSKISKERTLLRENQEENQRAREEDFRRTEYLNKLKTIVEEVKKDNITRDVTNREKDYIEETIEDKKTTVEKVKEPTENSINNLLPPSFDCGKASTRVEKLICNNAKIGDADGRMDLIYKKLQLVLSNVKFSHIKNSQRKWLKTRDQNFFRKCLINTQVQVKCIIKLYENRYSELLFYLKTET